MPMLATRPTCGGGAVLAAVLFAALPSGLLAQDTVTCASKAGERQHCPADTSGGVAISESNGEAACLLGKTWGYDDGGVWVADGCGGEFQLGVVAPVGAATPAEAPLGPAPTSAAPQGPKAPPVPVETWGVFDPGKGFLVGRGSAGELSISAYALVRYVNQMPGEQTFIDHLGNERSVDGRNDIWPHRVMVFFRGWLGTPKLRYTITLWTVLDTNQNAIFGKIGYQFSRKFSVYAGLNGNPGSRSLQGSHPYWLGHDRVMADEFFRPFFNSGVWASGEPVPGLWYTHARQHLSIARRHVEPAGPRASRPRPRCGGCRPPRSSDRAAPTATGSSTKRWPPGSASR